MIALPLYTVLATFYRLVFKSAPDWVYDAAYKKRRFEGGLNFGYILVTKCRSACTFIYF